MSKIKFWRSRREKRWQDGGLGLEYMHAPTEKEVVAMHGHVALLADGRQVSIFGFDPSRGAVGQVFVHLMNGEPERWVDLNELRIPRMPAIGSRWVTETGRVVTVVEDEATREAWHVVAESKTSIVDWAVEDWYAENKPVSYKVKVDTAYMVPPSDAASWPSAIGTIREAFDGDAVLPDHSPQPQTLAEATLARSRFDAWPGLDPKDLTAYFGNILTMPLHVVTAEDVMRADDEYVQHVARRPVVLPPAANSRHLRTSDNTSWRVIDTTAETVTAVCGSSYETFTLDEFARGFWSIVERDTKPVKTDGPVALAIREEAKRPPEGVSAEQWMRELLRLVEKATSGFSLFGVADDAVVGLVQHYSTQRRRFPEHGAPDLQRDGEGAPFIGPTPKYGRTPPPSAEERERWRAQDEARATRVRQETVARIRAERSGR